MSLSYVIFSKQCSVSFAGSNLFMLIPDSPLGCVLPTRSSYHSDQTLWCWLHAPTNMQFVFFLSFKKIDTQNLWSIKPVKYGPQFFPWRPLIDRVVMYLRSGMTACLCWHTDSQTVWSHAGLTLLWPRREMIMDDLPVERDCLLWWCACTTNEPSDLLLWQGNGAWKPFQTNPICNFIIREKLFAYLEEEIVHFTPSCSCTTLVMTQL